MYKAVACDAFSLTLGLRPSSLRPLPSIFTLLAISLYCSHVQPPRCCLVNTLGSTSGKILNKLFLIPVQFFISFRAQDNITNLLFSSIEVHCTSCRQLFQLSKKLYNCIPCYVACYLSEERGFRSDLQRLKNRIHELYLSVGLLFLLLPQDCPCAEALFVAVLVDAVVKQLLHSVHLR